ncbi:MAG: hypothetical protein HZB76_06675 [Chlamydiae bacterium]|nr:hypothetical protein [Chlamydiota bacterium]
MAATAMSTHGINYARLASEVFKTGKDAKKAWSEPGFNTGAMKCKLCRICKR